MWKYCELLSHTDWIHMQAMILSGCVALLIFCFFICKTRGVISVLGASLVAQMVKNSPAIQETWVQSLGWEDPLKKGMATHSSILAWRIPWTEEPDRLQFMGSQRVRHDWATFTFDINTCMVPVKIVNNGCSGMGVFWGVVKMSRSWLWWQLHNCVNILKCIDLCKTLNGQIIRCYLKKK